MQSCLTAFTIQSCGIILKLFIGFDAANSISYRMHLLVLPFFAGSINLLLNKSFVTDRDCSSFDSASDINARVIRLVMGRSRDFAYSLKMCLSFVNDSLFADRHVELFV
jgi:hypothetical protein